jgi:hypothetical protein
VRELHVVAVSEDGRHVLLAAKKGGNGTHRVRLDARLVAAVRGELSDPPAVDLTPKDIQARLRAGESAEDIAAAAGVPVTKVERFAGPVAGEMARTIAAAQEAHVVRVRRGPSTVPLGRAVVAAIGEPGAWTTYREDDGRWRVTVAWEARGRARRAAWLFEPVTKELLPVDPASAAIGHVDAEPRKAVRAPASRNPAKRSAGNPAEQPAGKAAKKAVKKAAAPKGRPQLRVVAERSPQPAADQRDGVRARATVPAWADVLLGSVPSAAPPTAPVSDG